ncbi:MAG: hypothetical protein ABIZ80_05675, partial [Bryobacteraceae bacterium]
MFFFTVIAWSFMSGEYGWSGLLSDGDCGLHIRIGDYIVANGRVPMIDIFSFSRPGQEWFAFEWGSEVIYSLLNAAFGLKGVVLLAGLVIAGVFTVLLRYTIWLGSNGLIALVLVLMGINATSIHFHARPHIFTLLFMVIAIWMLEADRRHRSRVVWLLVPLTVVWTNLHGGFLILFALMGLLVAGRLAESFLWSEESVRGRSDALRYALLGAACAAASLLNPYGIKLHLHIRETMQSKTIMANVQEFLAPTFRSEAYLHYTALLFLALMLSGMLLRRRRLVEVLWILFLGASSLYSARHVPLFALMAVPLIALELSDLWTRWMRSQSRKSVACVLDDVASQLQDKWQANSLWLPAGIAAL